MQHSCALIRKGRDPPRQIRQNLPNLRFPNKATLLLESASVANRRCGGGTHRPLITQLTVTPPLTRAVELTLDVDPTGTTDSRAGTREMKKPQGSVGIPRVSFIAGAGFEPATFGL
jgi:hypothetical protein